MQASKQDDASEAGEDRNKVGHMYMDRHNRVRRSPLSSRWWSSGLVVIR